MKIGLILCALAAIATSGCRSNRQEAFDFAGFRRLEPHVIENDLLVGRPSRPMILDSLLIYTDKFEGRLITVLNLNTGSYRRVLSSGRGPGEMMMIRRISYDSKDKTIRLFDNNANRLTTFSATRSFSDLFSVSSIEDVIDFSYDNVPFEMAPFGDGYIANGNFDGRQFSLLDGDGRSTGYFGVYPGNNDDAGSGDAFFMKNQTLMAVKPDQSRFAAAGYSNDQLVFYKAEKSGIPQKAREYFSYDSNIEVMGNEHGTRAMHTPETRSAYLCLYPTDKYLYASYNGRTIAEMTVPDASKDIYILKFDWDGKFIEGYVVGNIDDFAVDETAGRLYAFVYEDGDNILTAYDL